MNREEKTQAVEALKERFQKTCVTLLADYQGLKVSELTKLRQELRKDGAELKVLKNTLAGRALQGTDMEPLSKLFIGPTAVVTSSKDPVAPAKILVKFVKEFEKAKIKGGFLSGKVMNPSEVEALSKLPSREEMLAKMLGSMQAPAQNLVNVMSAIPRQLATVLAAIRDKKAA
ncbi:MAG TPA: 50S ribosomal protein L10 [Deltaproteobacteria bacterium]|nr:50S ribosomal protein L10 [Deltaproteobacteria bacterium]